jgi:hypothetical protein
LFSTGAFAALMLMQTKYQNRQGHLERIYRYGTQTLSRPPGATLSDGSAANTDGSMAAKSDAPPSGAVADDSDPTAVDDGAGQPPFAVGPHSPQQKLLIPLAPLRIITGATMVVAFIALQWSYLRRRAKAMQ